MRRINWFAGVCLAALAAGIAAMGQSTTAPSSPRTPTSRATHSASAPTSGASSRPITQPFVRATSHPAIMLTRPVEVELVASMGDGAFRHGASITRILILDAKRVLTVAADGTGRVWDRKTGKQLVRFDSVGAILDAVVIGKNIYTVGLEQGVAIWELETGKRLDGLEMEEWFSRIAVDPRGNLLALCGRSDDTDRSVTIWDLKSGTSTATLSSPEPPNTIAFDAIGERLLVGFVHGAIREFKLLDSEERNLRERDPNRRNADGTRMPRQNPDDDTGDILMLVMSPDKSKAMICCKERGAWLMDTGSGLELWRSKCEVKTATSATWSADQKTIVVAGGGKLCAIGAADGKTIWTADVAGTAKPAMACDDTILYCGMGNTLASFDVKTGKRLFPDIDKPLHCHPVSAVAAVNRLGLVLEGGSSPGLRLWDTRKGAIKDTWLPTARIDMLSTGQDESTLMVQSDKGLMVLETETGKTLRDMLLRSTADFPHRRTGVLIDNGRTMLAAKEPLVAYDVDTTKAVRRIESLGMNMRQCSQVAGGPRDQVMFIAGGKNVIVYSVTSRLESWVPVPEEVYDGQFFKDGVICWGKELYVFARLPNQYVLAYTYDLGLDNYMERFGDREAWEAVACVSPDGELWCMLHGELPQRRLMVGDFAGGKFNMRHASYPPGMPTTACFDAGGQLVLGNANGTVSVYRITDKGKVLGAASQPATSTSGPATTMP